MMLYQNLLKPPYQINAQENAIIGNEGKAIKENAFPILLSIARTQHRIDFEAMPLNAYKVGKI